MDQIKIGKFIAQLRKEKNLTQNELAQKLSITDRAISKWENGRGLPELGLLLPLCEVLEVSVNELLSGERLQTDVYQQKLEENVVETIRYSNSELQKHKKVFKRVLLVVGCITIILCSLFMIDVNRMNHNLPVVFSTWGFDYFPPVNLQDEYMELAIKEYLIDVSKDDYKYDTEQTFVSLHTYLIEEKEDYYYVYAWVLEESYYLENNCVLPNTGSGKPYRFKLNKNNIVLECDTPRDGSYYPIDMEQLFPRSVLNDMSNVYYDGTWDRLDLEIQQQVKLYFK